MSKNPVPLLLLLILVKNRNSLSPPVINTLQAEAFLDNAKKMVNTIDKINSFAQRGPAALPDMENIMKIAGPVLSALNSTESKESD